MRGKAVLLNFWATYCEPCKVEMPWFVELQKEYGPHGFQIVGVAMDDASTEDIAKFAKDMGVNYPILVGEESVGTFMAELTFCRLLFSWIATANWSPANLGFRAAVSSSTTSKRRSARDKQYRLGSNLVITNSRV